MQFSLQTLMLAFVVVAASVSLCGLWGFLLAAVLLACGGYIRAAKDHERAMVQVAVASIISFPFLCCLLFPVFIRINDYFTSLLPFKTDNNVLAEYAQCLRFSDRVFMPSFWIYIVSLLILVGATILFVRRPWPESKSEGEEQTDEAEEIRQEDMSEPEMKSEEKEADSSGEEAKAPARTRGLND